MRALPSHQRYASLPWLIVAMSVVVLVIGVIAARYVESRLVASKGESLALAASEIAHKLDLLLAEQYDNALELSRTHLFRKRDAAAQSAYLATVKKTHPIYLWLGVTDAGGGIVAATDPASIGRDRSGSAWFQAARDTGDVHVSDVEPFEETGGTDAVSFTAPITGTGGEFQGTVTTRVGLPALEEVVARTIRTFQAREESRGNIEYKFVRTTGDVFVDSDLFHKGNLNLKRVGLPSALLSESGRPGYFEEEHLHRHIPVVTGYARTNGAGEFPGLKWTVLLRTDKSDLVAPIRSVLWKLAAAWVLVWLPMFGFSIWSSARLREESTRAQHEHAHALAAESNYRQLVEQASDIIYRTDVNGYFTYVNPTVTRIKGYVQEELIGRHFTAFIRPDSRETVKRFLMRQFVQQTPSTYHEFPAIAKDGREIWIGQNVQALIENGQVTGFHAVARDITERKRMETALRDREMQMRLFMEATADCIWNWDLGADCITRNAGFERLFGYAAEEIVPTIDWWAERLHPDDRERVWALYQDTVASDRTTCSYEYRFRRRDGTYAVVTDHVFIVRDGTGKVVRALGAMTDITERKRAEEALRTNEQRMRAILDGALDAVVSMDERGVITDWNPQAEAIFGWSRSEAIGQNLAETIIPPRYREQHHHGMRHFLATGEGPLLNRRIEITALRRDGAEFPVELTVSYSMQGDSRRFTAFVADITERKRAEERLLLSREIISNAHDPISIMDLQGRFTYQNPAHASLVGFSDDELLGKTPALFLGDGAFASICQELTGAQCYRGEVTARTKDGVLKDLDLSVFTIRDATGKPTCFVAIKRDITERKQADKALRESERRFRTIFDQAPLGMAVVNSASGQFRRINQKYCEIVGYPHKEMLTRTIQDITHPDDLQTDLDNMARMMEGRIHNFQMEKRYIRKDGAVVWVNLMCVPLWWDHETDRRFHIAMVKDITERKKAEEEQRRLLAAVAQSRNHFEAIFRSTPSAISITTLKDGRFIEVNESAACLTGYSRQELLGRTSVELGLWVDPDERPDFVRKLVEKGQLLNWERQVRTKQGEIRDAIFCFERIQVDAEPCLISIAHDITERKRAEAALRERSRQQTIEAELSLLAVTAPDLPNLLNATTKLVGDVLGTEHCAVLQLLPNGKELLLQAGQGWKEGLVGHATMSTGFASLAGYTLLSTVPVVVEDFRAETRFKVHPLLHDHGIVSGVSFIIHGKDEPWGVLGAYTTTRRSFSRDDVDFFRTVCNILATAIERMQTEDVLRSANQTLRTLSRQLLQVQEEDRRTIARDLHDEIGQSLTAIKLNVERAQRTSDRTARERIMKDCAQITDSVLNQVRNLSLDLHPSILDDLGLSYALKWYADRQAERAGLKVEVTADPSGPRLPQDVEIACFRIAQEALTNVARHAQASRASITLKRLAKRVELRIQDDGVGFDVRTVQRPPGSGTNIGLTGMRERARLVGGEVHVKSAPQKGTEVTAIVPLPSAPSADATTPQAPPP